MSDAPVMRFRNATEEAPLVRWLLIDLVPWLREEFRVSVIEATVGRELRALGFRKLSARPRRDDQPRRALRGRAAHQRG